MVLLAACAPEADEHATAPNLLLLSVDTLRADHLGAYGHPLETSPTFDALAERGVRFTDATAQWPKTWPSMASMLTSQYPTQTGVRYAPRRPLPKRNLTLAEILSAAGYRTGGVVSNTSLGRTFGFDQGFDHFVESWLEAFRERHGTRRVANRPGLVKRFTNARDVVDEGLAWLDEVGTERPFFLWLHFMEPHGPYVPPPRYRGLFEGHYAQERVPLSALPDYQVRQGREDAPVRDLGFYRTRYDREIRHFDDELARLLDALEARGVREETLIVFTADHGESLGEHDYHLEHGRLPFQPGVHVPLVLVEPGRLPEGRVVREPVGLVDLLPTVLELLERPVPETAMGRSLLPLVRGEAGAAPPFVFFEAGERKPSQRGVRAGPWKLVNFRSPEDRAQLDREEYELYHVERDPGETRNLRAARPQVSARLRGALERYAGTGGEVPGDPAPLESENLDAPTREALRALGYLE